MNDPREEIGRQFRLTGRIVRRRTMWAGHVVRMEESRLPKKAEAMKQPSNLGGSRPVASFSQWGGIFIEYRIQGAPQVHARTYIVNRLQEDATRLHGCHIFPNKLQGALQVHIIQK